MEEKIFFTHPSTSPKAKIYISECLDKNEYEKGRFTQLVTDTLKSLTAAQEVLPTHSCTAALEMCALLLNLGPGDEVIMPAYTFVSTANAFVLRGATPVFVDIRPDTLNIDETLIEAAITKNTKAIVAVHYAGVGCEMKTIMAIAEKHKLYVIEDAAQAIAADYDNKPLGSFGHLATLSFHYTKNVMSGMGGALLINDETLLDRAKIIWQKGTNREAFFQGKVDKYSWVDVGSSYMMGEIAAALLYSQLENLKEITEARLQRWEAYHRAFTQYIDKKLYALPTIPHHCNHNAHCYYLILNTPDERNNFIRHMAERHIEAYFHYTPLHDSPAGKRFTKQYGELSWTEHHAARLVRLPLYPELSEKDINRIIQATISGIQNNHLMMETLK